MKAIEYKKENVLGYEEYSVDTNGVVYSKKNKPLKYSINHRGYCIVNFMINGKRKGFAVHTLVAKQFITNKDINKTQVNHKNGDKTDNNIDNLEWVTPKENMIHSVKILGNYLEDKNINARSIYGIDVKTHEIKYKFTSLIGAARFFGDNEKRAKYIQNVLWQVLNHIKKSYRKCLWFYEDEYQYALNNDINIIDNYEPKRGFRKLSDNEVKWIRKNYIPHNKELSIRKIAKRFNVDKGVISKIINYETYKDVC